MTNPKWNGNPGESQPKSILNDITKIQLNIDKLVAQFIHPIERFRSYTSPNVTGQDLIQNSLAISKRHVESRCHTFYRILGLPTISPDGGFFSPGYPILNAERQKAVFSKLDSKSSIRLAAAERERQVQRKESLFTMKNADATVLSIVMGAPNCSRKFAIEKYNLTLDNIQFIPQAIPDRTKYLNQFYITNDDKLINNNFDSVLHQLVPFATDPVISANVEPKSGSGSVLVGAPFLDKKILEYESNKYALRPGIEFILRLRLREQHLISQLKSSIPIENLNLSIPVDKTEAGLITIGISNEDASQLFALGFISNKTVSDLLTTFYGLIFKYHQSLKSLDKVTKSIMWVPSPGSGGPESGTEISTAFIKPKSYLDSWEIDIQIINLKVKSSLAKYQTEIGYNTDGSALSYDNFTISEFQNVADDVEKSLAQAEASRANFENNGSDALRMIELLGGEVSGLGLIDIIAIYLALWSVDVEVLLDLIDDEAAKRLVNITELKTDKVIARANKLGNAKSAYEILANQIASILAEGDRTIEILEGMSKSEAGDIPRNMG
jgi:hypothetical protein